LNTETLYDCPKCGRKGFTRRGLAAHRCRSLAPDNVSTARPHLASILASAGVTLNDPLPLVERRTP
jgi:hypothetical protein